MVDETASPAGKQLAFPLPETAALSMRGRPRSSPAVLDQIISKLWAAKDFRQYLDALTNKSAITGVYVVDRGFAAKRIQDEANKSGLTEVATAKLSKIMRAIETILRRDKLGRKQRLAALNIQAAE